MNALAAAHAAADATRDVITEARTWAKDFVINPDAVDHAADHDVIAYIDHEYGTGWTGFLADHQDQS